MNKTSLDNENIFTITDFLSPDECASFIAQSEQIGYEEATIAGTEVVKELRNNSRIVLDDPALAGPIDGALPESSVMTQWSVLTNELARCIERCSSPGGPRGSCKWLNTSFSRT
jgi:hypothetical protein